MDNQLCTNVPRNRYDKTYSDECMHGYTVNCTFNGTAVPNPQARTWGHTVSKDGATWEDWPGVVRSNGLPIVYTCLAIARSLSLSLIAGRRLGMGCARRLQARFFKSIFTLHDVCIL